MFLMLLWFCSSLISNSFISFVLISLLYRAGIGPFGVVCSNGCPPFFCTLGSSFDIWIFKVCVGEFLKTITALGTAYLCSLAMTW